MPKDGKRNCLRPIKSKREILKKIGKAAALGIAYAFLLFALYLGILNAWTWGY